MVGILGFAILGFLLGMRHAIDPDHVVAVTAIASTEPTLRRASRIGLSWGLGHTVTIVVVGGAIILFRLTISPRVGLALEFAVAIMLIVVGLGSIFGRRFHHQAHAAPTTNVRPLLIGMVHGLAGSAAVALLALAAVDRAVWGVAYLLLFGLGTIVGMMLVTTLIALPATYATSRVASARRTLAVASGAASLVFGLVLAVQIGVVDGLFTSAPHWLPK
jgi:sulfite exporter TauE/SafE